MPGANLLPSIVNLARAVVDGNDAGVTIDSAKLQAFASSSVLQEVQSSPYVRLPVNFDSQEAELNFHMFLGIIDMGSSFDELLQGKVQRTYRQAMQYGVLGLHLSGQTLDTVFMLNKFSAYHIVTVFGIDASEELPVRPDLPYVTMSRPGPLQHLQAALVNTVRATGKTLQAMGKASLGAWLLDYLNSQPQGTISADVLVQELASTFPEAFGDESSCKTGSTTVVVPFLRKAQGLVDVLYQRFAQEDARFCFTNIHNLAADSGPYTLSVLVQQGVVRCTACPTGTPVSAEMECALRAAVVVACHAIAAQWGGGTSASALGHVLFRRYEQDMEARASWRMVGEADQVPMAW